MKDVGEMGVGLLMCSQELPMQMSYELNLINDILSTTIQERKGQGS